jgi:type IV secretory pathway component VirB8
MRAREILRDCIQWVVREIQDDDAYPEIEKNLIEPILSSILKRLLPYIITSSIVFLLILVFLVISITWFLPLKQ